MSLGPYANVGLTSVGPCADFSSASCGRWMCAEYGLYPVCKFSDHSCDMNYMCIQAQTAILPYCVHVTSMGVGSGAGVQPALPRLSFPVSVCLLPQRVSGLYMAVNCSCVLRVCSKHTTFSKSYCLAGTRVTPTSKLLQHDQFQ